MNLLRPQFIIIIILFLLVIAALVFLRMHSTSQNGVASPPPIQIFEQASSPSPQPRVKVTLPSPPLTPSVPYDQLTQQQKEQAQAQADEYYQKTENAVLNNYPWYPKLPLQDTGYFVYFNYSSEIFKADLFPQKASSVPLDEQINQLKNTVIQQINAIGADTSRYSINWEITPK